MPRGPIYTKEELLIIERISEDNPYISPQGIAKIAQRYGWFKDRDYSNLVDKIREVIKDNPSPCNYHNLAKENKELKKRIKVIERQLGIKLKKAIADKETAEKASKYDELIQIAIGRMYKGKTNKGAEMPYLDFLRIQNWLSENEKELYLSKLDEIGLGGANAYQLKLL